MTKEIDNMTKEIDNMDANILCTLLAQRIPPEQFQLWGLDVHWMAPEYDTPENRAIVEDVIANYTTLAVAVAAAECLSKINQAVNAYICSHYDLGTQASLQAIYVQPTTPQAAKDLLLTVWDWAQSVLVYYYAQKAEITASPDPVAVTWDFSQFDATDPGVTLQSLLG